MPGWPRLNTGSSSKSPNLDKQHEIYDRSLPEYPHSDSPLPDRSPGQHHEISHNVPQRRLHQRSLSDKIPSFFNGTKKKSQHPTDFESSSVPLEHSAESSDRQSHPRYGRTNVDDSELETGRCPTCNAKVRWPRTVAEFRCGSCLMINDLKPIQLKLAKDPDQQSLQRAVTFAGPASKAKVPHIALDRTQTIIDGCLLSYLKSRKKNRIAATPPQSQPSHHFHVEHGPSLAPPYTSSERPITPSLISSLPTFATYSGSPNERLPTTRTKHERQRDGETPNSHTSPSPSSQSTIARKLLPRSTEELPVRPERQPPVPPINNLSVPSMTASTPSSRNTSPAPQTALAQDLFSRGRPEEPRKDTKYLFQALEDYIIRGFGEHECLNHSFLPYRPVATRAHTNEDDIEGRDLAHTTAKGNQSETALPELDAKMLLLGDVAENGLWWTGNDGRANSIKRRQQGDRHANHQRSLVHSKSPCVSWLDVERWYNAVLTAGSTWRQIQIDHRTDLDSDAEDPEEEAKMIEHELAGARAHVHRTLLRTTESLLKRPGKPLKSPSDIRFLLILLSNPMLYPNGLSIIVAKSQRKMHESDDPGDQDNHFHSDKPIATDSESAWDKGQAFGIIKRILGLLANLPIECHRYLTAWFMRLDEERFRAIVDLIQRFVTYRLKRQHGRKKSAHNPVGGLIPTLSGTGTDTSAQLHAALGLTDKTKQAIDKNREHASYSDDWQIKAASKVMSLFFGANKNFQGQRTTRTLIEDASYAQPGSIARNHMKIRGQLLSTSDFYNTMVDYADLVADFDIWEASRGGFAFCQYPFFLSVGSKIRIMEHDARRQMEIRAREAFFDSITRNKSLKQYFYMKVRRDCIAEDSLKTIREIVGTGQEEIKKGLKVEFVGEEGIDAGGLRKEWFLLLIREIFDAQNGMFTYDEESRLCYFNPNSFESSELYFLVGSLLGLAIYNSTILDVALPPFIFKKLLAAGPAHNAHRPTVKYTLEDLAEYRPSLAKGLGQLLSFDGDVQETFCRDFVVEVYRYGIVTQMPLGADGARRPVTASNRQEFVDLYIRFILDEQVTRQFEPFKRGFFTVCGGNALSLFQPEEIELLVRGSDEPLDVPSLKGVAVYENWKSSKEQRKANAEEEIPVVQWFWEFFESANTANQRKLLGFITGSDRIPAAGATNLIIKIAFAGYERERYPIARTCFNQILLYDYRSKQELQNKLWRAVTESEGFGLK